MTFTARHDANYYLNLRTQILGNEGSRSTIYNPGDHVPTIGYGYTFVRFNGSTWAKYEHLDADLAAIGRSLTTAQRTTIGQIAIALNQGRDADADLLITQLSSSFGALNAGDPDTLFQREADQQGLYLRARMRNILGTVGGDALYASLSDTVEKRALIDLAYFRGAGNVNADLIRALHNQDRAEAWFQLRYRGIPSTPQPGHISRVYLDADIFGLYDTPGVATHDEALEIYVMLQQHRVAIETYEGTYPPPPSVQALTTALTPARDRFVSDLQSQYAGLTTTLTGAIVADRIFVDAVRTLPSGPIDQSRSNPLSSVILDSQGNEIASDDLLVGYGGHDTLTAGAGDDILVGGVGDDYLRGGVGNDTYVYRSGDGADWIRDAGRDGSIVYNGVTLTGAAAVQWIDQQNPQLPAWRAEINGHVFYFRLHEAQIDTSGIISGSLWIQEEGAASDDRIVVEQFETRMVNGQLVGDLGLNLPLNPLVLWYVTVNGIANPFSEPTLPPPLDPIQVREGSAQSLAIALNMPARDGQILRIAVDNFGSALQIVTGAESLSLSNGFIDLTLVEGQSSVTFSLLANGDLDASGSVNLSAELLPVGGGAGSPLANLTVDITAVNEGLGQPETTTLIDPTDPNAVDGYRGSYDANVYGTSANDLVYTRSLLGPGNMVFTATDQGGNDVIIGADGADAIYGGAGDDWISGGGHTDHILGDVEVNTAGNNSIDGGTGADLIFGREGRDEIWGETRVDVNVAIATGDLAESIDERGDYMQGGGGDDQIVGGNGWDVISGGAGRDVLVGMGGNDLITGDRVYALTGTYPSAEIEQPGFNWDWVIQRNITTQPDGSISYSLAVADRFPVEVSTPEGGAADTIHAGSGNDAVLAGSGDDFADGGAGNDLVAGEDGNDTLLGGAGDDILDGGDASDASGSDFLDGGIGNDILAGGNGNDTLYGGAGNDTLSGDDPDPTLGGADYLNGEDGNDVLFGGARGDTLIGGIGNDEMYGDTATTPTELQGDDYLEGNAGDDYLVGAGGSDTLLGGADADQLFGDGSGAPTLAQGNDQLDGGTGNDILVGGGADDILLGGEGADQLHGDDVDVEESAQGSDFLDGGVGDDTLVGYGGSDTLLGGEGNDQLHGDLTETPVAAMGDDVLDGGAGDDSLFGYGGDDTLRGGEGVDLLSAGDGNDQLDGGEGNDSLQGGAGNDVLRGGAGIDVLQGGAGDDTYVLSAQDLQISGAMADGIIDTQGENRIVFTDLALSSLTMQQGSEAGSINFATADGTTGLVVRDALSGSVAAFEFADGAVITSQQLLGSLYDGNADQTSTADGAMLIGGMRADSISGVGDGATISGGVGNDLLIGGSGTTTYQFDRGDGVDTITDASAFVASEGESRNILELGASISQDDVSLALTAGGTQLRIELGTGDALNLTQAVQIDDIVAGLRTFDEVRFADGTASSWQDFLSARRIAIANTGGLTAYAGTNSHDDILGSALGETVDAGAGDDILESSGGNDVLTGGTGSDTYVFAPGGGADTIVNTGADSASVDRVLVDATLEPTEVSFYRVADSLLARIDGTQDQLFVTDYFGSAGLDQIVFNDGTVYTVENIPLDELPQNELTYSRGAGLQTFAVNDPSDSIFDRLRFGSNVDPSFVFIGSNSNGDLVIRFRNPDGSVNAADRVTITGGVTNPAAVLNQIVFDADPAIVWNLADIQSRARLPSELGDFIYGTASDEVLNGLAGNDTIHGGAGNDVLDGDEGSDVLNGGDGNDTIWGEEDTARGDAGDDLLISQSGTGSLSGGAGSDTYVIHRGTIETALTLMDVDSAPTSTDVLTLGPGISAADLRIRQSGNDLRIEVVDRSRPGHLLDNRITVSNYFLGSSLNTVVDEVRFSDDPSLVWTLADVRAQLLIGDELSDVINGSATSEVLQGNGGDDVLNALGGNDDVDGGTGRDQLNGGDGDDIYRFALGHGSDEILDSSGIDRIELGAGISPAGVTLHRSSTGGFLGAATPFSGDSLVIVVNGSNEQLLVENYFAVGDTARVEEIRFADGTVWDSAAITAAAIDVSGTADTQMGTAADDTFTVNHASDVVTEEAGAGTDTINSTVSYALGANAENLTLLGNLSLSARGNTLANALVGNAGDNRLDGDQGIDTLVGGTGDDIYIVDAFRSSTFDSHYSNFQDIVIEQLDEGTDTIIGQMYSAIIPVNVERFILSFTLGAPTSFPGNADLTQRFTGNALDNYIDASAASPYFGAGVLIDGGAGADVMIGSSRANVYIIDNAGDVIGGEDTWTTGGADRVESYIDYALDDRIENLTLRGTVAISAIGNAMVNTLIGNDANNLLNGAAGNDVLDGGIGLDTMLGGTGDDTYTVDTTSDLVTEYANEGADLVTSRVNYVLGANVENLSLLDSAIALSAGGNELNNAIVGNRFNNVLDGNAGNDQLNGGLGNDRYVGFGTLSGMDVIGDTSGIDSIELAPEEFAVGQLQFSRVGNDMVVGLSATSAVRVQGWFASTANQVEHLVLTHEGLSYRYLYDQMQARAEGVNAGPRLNVQPLNQSVAAGQALQYQLTVNTFADIESQDALVYTATLSGGASLPTWLSFDATTRTFTGTPTSGDLGNFGVTVTATDGGGLSTSATLFINVTPRVTTGTTGDDTLTGDDAVDIIHGLAGNDTLLGQGGADQLFGEEGNDTLDGGAGADDMRGASGDDIYIVDDLGDVAFEVPGEGTDEVRTTITYSLANGLSLNVENLVLLGTQAIGGTGNFLGNYIIGNAASNALSGGDGNDTLDGGASNDSMSGGLGDDVFFVDHANDTTAESSGQGTDTVRSTLNWTLASNVENLVLLGSGNITGAGNGLANQLTGNAGNNALNGGGGADTLTGAAGNDTYTVDSAGDVIVENAGEGIDLVQSGVTFALTANVENLTLTGTSVINGTGNALDNVITGNSVDNTLSGGDGNDTINGGSGVDTMSGGLGNDTYVVAQAGDIVNENAGEGTDLVQSSIAWTLGANVENLTLTGSTGVSGTGNALSNILIGNSGANALTGGDGNDILDGGSGTDNMSGGQGDDVYFVNTSSDVTTEAVGQGLDIVNSSVTRTLGADIELLFLTGTSAINGTGNGLSNLLRGNGVNNTLMGGAGIDILEGGAGNDTLSNTTNKSLLNGGADTDTLTGTAANDLLIGGTGNDALTTGAGADIIVFNRGDGQDTVGASTTRDNTVSIGGAVYADLLFQKNGNDLVLHVGATDQITFVGYYTSSSNRSVNNLQVVIEGTSEYDAGSADAMRNKKIETFDFEGLVAAFDAARAADPGLTTWALTNALLVEHLSGSDAAAIGGDLAYRYNRFGTLSDISFTPALGILGASGFGTTAQALQGLASLQDSSARLS